jgi:hypothetical protein
VLGGASKENSTTEKAIKKNLCDFKIPSDRIPWHFCAVSGPFSFHRQVYFSTSHPNMFSLILKVNPANSQILHESLKCVIIRTINLTTRRF